MRTLGAILWIFAGLALAACDGSDETDKTGGKPAPQVAGQAGEVAGEVIVAGGLPTDPARGNLPTLAPLVDAVAPSAQRSGSATRRLW